MSLNCLSQKSGTSPPECSDESWLRQLGVLGWRSAGFPEFNHVNANRVSWLKLIPDFRRYASASIPKEDRAVGLKLPLPSSLPWMESVDAKIVRAGEHLDALTVEIFDSLKAAVRKSQIKIDGQNRTG